MIRIFTVVLAMLIGWISPISTEVIAGATTTVGIEIQLPIEVNDLVFYVDYDSSNMEIVNISRGTIFIPDDAMCVMQEAYPGHCSVGILCPTIGIVGEGTIMEIEFKVNRNCNTSQTITIDVAECVSIPLDGDTTYIEYDVEDGVITVVEPTITNALDVLRAVLRLQEAPMWADVNNDDFIDTSDVLKIIRLAHNLY